jgi:DDE superfamily endonuclease
LLTLTGHNKKQHVLHLAPKVCRDVSSKRQVTLQPPTMLDSGARIKLVLDFQRLQNVTKVAQLNGTSRETARHWYPGESKRACYWVQKGHRPRVKKVNNPMAVNVYAGITKLGITKLHFVAGTSKQQSHHRNLKGQPARNITKSEYKDVLEMTLLPWGDLNFRAKGCTKWIFQQDNDPTHRIAMATIQAWNKAHPGCEVSLLPAWPGNSPDLSPIENLWAWAQAKVDAAGCKSFEEFKNCVESTLETVPPKMLLALVNSMTTRLKMCIKNGGYKTGY